MYDVRLVFVKEGTLTDVKALGHVPTMTSSTFLPRSQVKTVVSSRIQTRMHIQRVRPMVLSSP